MRAAIAGAGIGGLTLALTLQARGIESVVFDRSTELGEAGAGVQLGPNAVKVLDRLGLGEVLRSAGFRPEAAEVRDAASGALLLRSELGEGAQRRSGAPYLQVHRADLQALLLSAVREGGLEVALGRPVTGVDAEGGVRFVDGSTTAADVVVGCDGVRSACADALFGAEAARFIGQVAWRALLRREDVAAEVPPVAAVWAGGARHVVHYPVCGGRMINLVAVTEARRPPGESWTQRGDPAALSRAFADWPSPVPQLIAAAREIWCWSLHDRPPRPRWSRGRATLLGDAAHPMLPFLAQGAGMAIEDAWVLAAHLARAAKVEAALAAYEAERRPRASRVQAWSRRNARLFHLPPPLARAAFTAGRLTGAAERQLDWLYGWEPGA